MWINGLKLWQNHMHESKWQKPAAKDSLKTIINWSTGMNNRWLKKYWWDDALRCVCGCCFTWDPNPALIHHLSPLKMNVNVIFNLSFHWAFTPCFLSFSLSYWVSLLRSHFLSLGWDNPPCRGLQSAGQPGKSLNYPFALKLKPNHNSPQSVRLCTPASLRLIVSPDFFFFFHTSTVKMERWN